MILISLKSNSAPVDVSYGDFMALIISSWLLKDLFMGSY